MDRRWIADPAGVGSASWNTVVPSRSAGVHARGPVGDDGVAGSVRFTAPGGEVDIEALFGAAEPFDCWVAVDGVAIESTRRRCLLAGLGNGKYVGWLETVQVEAGEHVVDVRATPVALALCQLKVNHG